ncbi:Met31p Ecym_2536 [Eremothecium cymbalariae DBVPG|uniref:C2H2-type domain-containing protein n=1 Tax=Eremothecium cymbalariae (strain CBS 270.75 / DBVPG 7215 / KCTC 17166 / NRRL Y-17582) TaxID=931890 RepID=G8JQ98_ERECY|nr:Hypothetical protein Ecym_2536 [Eremothecium cymbalariae DBVPG\
MSDRIFFQRAAEAIMHTSMNGDKVDPTIRELLNRIKYMNPNRGLQADRSQLGGKQGLTGSSSQYAGSNDEGSVVPTTIASEKRTVLNYFDKLLTVGTQSAGANLSPDADSTSNDGTPSEGGVQKRQKKSMPSWGNRKKGHTRDLSSSFTASETPSEERKFHCSKCELVFRRSGDLRRHEKVHLSILPNICSLCGKGFARKDALKRHFNTLTCKRNRQKLLSIGGDISEILEKARQNGAKV